MKPLPTVAQLVDIAMSAEEVDPINWGELNITKEAAYEMMANHALSLYSTQGEDRDIILLSSFTKLVVENFILNLRLQKYETR
jgi:hypothetical protein|tara:strand:+ start:415 stop:663 length:249 start_codon:yes stop_codon:yes gene_type:complete